MAGEIITFQAPYVMRGKKKIAEDMGVSEETVEAWVRERAPICMIGRRWTADYLTLMQWLVAMKPAWKLTKYEDGDEN